MDMNPGTGIGSIQKILSAQWKNLKPEEKEVYVQLARKGKARYAQELLLEQAQDNDKCIKQNAMLHEVDTCIYPLGRVRKIVQSDPEVGKVSKDALIAIAKASELFAQFLGTKSYEQALYRNKRQIKVSDVTRTIQTTASLDWLREDFPDIKSTPVNVTAEYKAKENRNVFAESASFFKPRMTGKINGTALEK